MMQKKTKKMKIKRQKKRMEKKTNRTKKTILSGRKDKKGKK